MRRGLPSRRRSDERRCWSFGSLADIGEGSLEDLVAAGADARDGGCGGDRGWHAEQVKARAVVPGDAPAGEDGAAAARPGDLGDVAIGAGGRRADDLAQMVVLDEAHHGFGVADGTRAGEE